jgi:hypothetical protein
MGDRKGVTVPLSVAVNPDEMISCRVQTPSSAAVNAEQPSWTPFW